MGRISLIFMCKHLFDLSFAEVSERNRKLRNADKSAWKEAQIVSSYGFRVLFLRVSRFFFVPELQRFVLPKTL